jgi:hypothetical protein
VVDGDAGAGQVLQVLGVVLVTEHVGRLAALQGGANAVGADLLLGVAEAGGQVDPVEVPLQVGIGGQPGQDHPGRVGQDHADRLPVQVVAQVPEHRHRAAGQRRVQVGVADIRQLDVVGGHVPLPRPRPRGEDRAAHLLRLDRVPGQEVLPGPRELIRAGHAPAAR